MMLLFFFVASSCVQLPTSVAVVRDYTVQSACMRQPEKALVFTQRAADFWKHAYDPVDGGFFTMVERTGTPVTNNHVKTVLTQSRNAYGFARAYMLTGDEEYLRYARYALDFLYSHGWDKDHGGFHAALNKKGELDDAAGHYSTGTQKWSFIQNYAMVGPAAMYDATRRQQDYEILLQARSIIDKKLWDNRKGYEGYYSIAHNDWSFPQDKGFAPTIDALATHGFDLPLLTDAPDYRKRLVELADNIVINIIPTNKTLRLGFVETYDSNWKPKDDSFLLIGHVLKTAWCLGRAYLIEPKSAYIQAAELLMLQVWTQAWDHRYGAPYYSADNKQGTIFDHHKEWWTVEQAIVAGLTLYYITGNDLYLKMADQAMMFFSQYQLDEQYGEAFAAVNPGGGPMPNTLKGDYWKAGYHTIETGFYVYLYGNLFLHQRPVSLFYRIEQERKDRTLHLNPLAIGDEALRIDSVLLNDKPYTNFDATGRTVFIPAGPSGELKVTFAIQKTKEPLKH